MITLIVTPIISVEFSLSVTASPHKPEDGSLEYFCLSYKGFIGATESDCHEMFYNNNVRTDTGWVFVCNLSKSAGNAALPGFARALIGYVQCHADPMGQLSNASVEVEKLVNDLPKLSKLVQDIAPTIPQTIQNTAENIWGWTTSIISGGKSP